MKSGINPNKSTRICTNLHESTPIDINLHQSTSIYINRHKSRFKALQALFLADIAHYNYKSSCGLSKGLKMLASMILSPLSKVVLEAWGKCVLGYTLLPNCCAENGLHPCTIFQVGKHNSPKCTNLGSCDHPQASLANRLLCAQKYNLLFPRIGKSKKSLHSIKTLFFRISPPPHPPRGFSLFSPGAHNQSAWNGSDPQERPP